MKRVIALVAALLLLSGVTPATAATPGSVTPDRDSFYTPPANLPPRNGDLIRSRPFTAYVSPVFVNGRLVPIAAKSWQIMYRSTDATGHPIAVTGSVLVPYTPRLGDRPIVAYTPGTVGPGDSCAPSYGLATGSWYESVIPSTVLAAGYAVVVPDYEGVGGPGPSTYVTGWSEGHTVLDGIRAAQRLASAQLSVHAPTAIWGYSQGGSATAWAAQLQPGYAPEINLKGVAAGGVPGDLNLAARHLQQLGDIHLAVWAAMGLHHAYPELQWDELLTPLGREKVALAETKCETVPLPGVNDPDNGKNLFQGLTMSDLFITNPLSLPDWQAKITLNNVGAIAPQTPAYLYGSRADSIVAYDAQRYAFHNWCLRGVNARWQDTVPLDHAEAAIIQAPAALAWIGARFAGLPATSTC